MLQPTGAVTWVPLVGCNIPKPTHTGVIGLAEIFVDDETNKVEFRFINPWPPAANEIDPTIDPTEKPKSINVSIKPVVKVKPRVVR